MNSPDTSVHFVNKFFICLFLALMPLKALGTLGDSANSIDHVQHHFQAKRTISFHEKYTTHTMTYEGHIIQEYVDRKGKVFAVTWRGWAHPDPDLLLGSYLQETEDTASEQPQMQGRAPVALQSTHVVIQKFGHQRDIRGRAYLPSLVPSGVDVADLE